MDGNGIKKTKWKLDMREEYMGNTIPVRVEIVQDAVTGEVKRVLLTPYQGYTHEARMDHD